MSDGTEITTLNFTKGNDGWDPFKELISDDVDTSVKETINNESNIIITSDNGKILVKGIKEKGLLNVYNLNGNMVISEVCENDYEVSLPQGIWIIRVNTPLEVKTSKNVIRN